MRVALDRLAESRREALEVELRALESDAAAARMARDLEVQQRVAGLKRAERELDDRIQEVERARVRELRAWI